VFAKHWITLACSALLTLHACAPAANPIETAAATDVATPIEAPAATSPPKPTQAPTATVWPPVFDFFSLKDIRELNSFVVTIDEKNTVNGQLTQRTITIGFIQEPYSAYRLFEHTGGVTRTYIVGGMTYELSSSGDWTITAGSNVDIFQEANIPAGHTGKLIDAQFAAEEEYEGVQAYHFVLEPVNSSEGNGTYQLEGDFYLAKEGNYVLYSYWKETSKSENFSQVYEVTEELSSINQLTEITLPTDMREMISTADLPFELALPLPADSSLSSMIRYKHGIGVDYYYFSTPKTSIDEFLDFYRNLPPTDGWTVSHVGHVSLHENDCEFSRECVIINKGSTQVVLYYNGATIRAEFDWPHLYSPR
jgi:hypothetical protein